MTNLRVVGDAVVDDDEIPTFESFWLLFPKRVAKLDAKKAWARISEKDRVAALVGLVAWRQLWMQNDPQFVPHAASWLRGERWTDELPEQWAASRPASHAAFAPDPEPVERTKMPQSVRDAIAKLRK